jgi:hypothetical protein
MPDATETPAPVNKAIDWQSLLRINLAREATSVGVGSFMVVIYQRKAGRQKQKNNKKQVTAARQERGANDNPKTAPVTGTALTSSCLLEEQDTDSLLVDDPFPFTARSSPAHSQLTYRRYVMAHRTSSQSFFSSWRDCHHNVIHRIREETRTGFCATRS